MKIHHKWYHSWDTIRRRNQAVLRMTECTFLLKDQSTSGEVLDLPITDLKTIISSKLTALPPAFLEIEKFIKGYERFDLTEFADKTQDAVLLERPTVEDFASTLKTDILKVSITSKDKLATVSATNPLSMSTPLQMYPTMQYTGIMNDLLDASSYVLSGVDPNSGEALTIKDEDKKKTVRSYLNQFVNFQGFPYGIALAPEVALMNDVRDWVLSRLDTTPLLDIAAYIDVNVPKLPLVRRNWAIGR